MEQGLEDAVVPGWTEPARIASVQASDGYPLRYRIWDVAPQTRARGTLILLNGIMSNSSWFSPLVPALTQAGFVLVGADRRGSGLNEAGWGDAPSAAQLVEDVLSIVNAQADPERPVLMVGWCWGAALAVMTAAKLGERASGLVLVTPGMFNTPALRAGVEAQRAAIAAAAEDDPVVQSPIDETWFTASEALDGFIRRDPHRVLRITPRLVDITSKLATAAVARLRRLSLPLLVLLASDEQATDNVATRAALQRLDNPGLDVQELPTKHGMQFDAPQQVAGLITGFAARLGL